MNAKKKSPGPLDLRPGDIVRVKGPTEILSLLDEKGRVDGMPFMPEMLNSCGKVFAVGSRADKTCDTATRTGGRQLRNTVHLAGERCDGSSHGGCQAACLNFWKESWLERASDGASDSSTITNLLPGFEHARTELQQFSSASLPNGSDEETVYSCQATELPNFTQPLRWWDLRQYWRDLSANRVGVAHFLKVMWLAFYGKLADVGIGYRLLISLYDAVQRARGGQLWPRLQGTLEKTPTGYLDLKPGDIVRVKAHSDILSTLDRNNKNRGLWFDAEMVRYCGNIYRVKSRVDHIINEGTGKMMRFGNPCIILEDVWCRSEWSYCRLFCPRSIYSYWREIWLERVTDIT